MTRILAIDPGSERSAWLDYDPAGAAVRAFGLVPNDELLDSLRLGVADDIGVVVIETIEPRYGLQMGWSTLDTARWTGRFEEAARSRPVVLLKRSDVLRHLGVVTSPRKGEKRVSADAGVTAALIDRFGGSGGKAAAVGLKASPGPLYGVIRDVWSALAIAVTHADGAR